MVYRSLRPLSLAAIQQRIAMAAQEPDILVVLAGAPAAKLAPGGMSEILQRGGHPSGLGFSGGLTLIKSAAAFTAPALVTTNTHERVGTRVEHYATIQRTTAADATHESFYPAPGEHLRPGMAQMIGGRSFNHYWDVSKEISELIRQGEQEHLNDALRAYELTYQKIETEINALAGQRCGPANNPAEANKLAEAALARRLPPELGTNPATWAQVLDRLLQQTKSRDTNGWHALSIDPPRTTGNKILDPVVKTQTTNIGVPSAQVVNY